MPFHKMLSLLPLILLTSCGQHSEPEPMSAKDTVFAPTVEALDKAKSVQQTIDAAASSAAAVDAEH